MLIKSLQDKINGITIGPISDCRPYKQRSERRGVTKCVRK